MRALVPLVILLAGCFPYRERYRPEMQGVVRDAAGAPVAGARVVSCSASRWSGMGDGCPRPARAVTDGQGRFHIEQEREWEWCCLGEAPLPYTIVVACRGDEAAALRVSAPEAIALSLSRAPAVADDRASHYGAPPEEKSGWVLARCRAP